MHLISPEAAIHALRSYGLVDVRVHLLSEVDCTVFRVTASGIEGETAERSAVLKIYPANKQDVAAIHAEVDWLQALSDETDLRVPRPLAAQDGSVIQSVPVDMLGHRPGVLYTWVEGRSLDRELVAEGLQRIGGLVGSLHRHSERWQGARMQRSLKRTFTQQAFGWVLDMERPPTLSTDAWDVLVRAAARLKAETAAIGQGGTVYGFIHSDLYLSNFLFHEDRVGAIDFSDCAWGHFADDMASVLVFLKHPWVGNFDHSAGYDRLRDAFFQGYQEVRALPPNLDAMLDTYFAARIFLLLAYVHEAADHVPWVPECVRQSQQYLRYYLESPSNAGRAGS